jgi:hypothetical protein
MSADTFPENHPIFSVVRKIMAETGWPKSKQEAWFSGLKGLDYEGVRSKLIEIFNGNIY